MTVLDLSLDDRNKLFCSSRSALGNYYLWRRGYDLRQHLSKSTFYRHRKILLTYGVDISVLHPNPERETVVPLQRIIEAVPVAIPDWAYERGLIVS
jgi:II/X family phage/plasmid replication protein